MRRKLLKYIVRNLLKGVTVDDDLLIRKGSKLFIGKRELTQEEIIQLQDDAITFGNSLIWKLMSNNIYWIANFKMMQEADKEDEMFMGRAMTLIISTLQEFIDKLK